MILFIVTTCCSEMAELPADAETEPVCGRPQVEVDMGEVDKLIRMGFTKTKIADIMGISRKTLYTKIMAVQQQGPSGIVSNRYVQMTDDELDTKVKSIKQTHPQYGEVMIVGHLRQDGIRLARSRIRASIHRVDPDGVAERRSKAVKRRVYQVGFPNDIWHIDGNHKLIRWRFVVHGGIDGFSRLITFLACNSNNCAKTMLNAFEEGIQKCGWPRKIRSDHGGENVDVWRSMMMAHGSQQCVIVGSSTHNERIERLWRDVHRSVLLTFSTLFRELESREHLDPLNEVDIYCLQKIFLPIINESLSQFAASWNHHSLSTENMQTPMQLFYAGQLQLDDTSQSSSDSEADHETVIPSHDPVSVPRCTFKPCQLLLQTLRSTTDAANCSQSAEQGSRLYMQATDIVGQHLMTSCHACQQDSD